MRIDDINNLLQDHGLSIYDIEPDDEGPEQPDIPRPWPYPDDPDDDDEERT